MKFRKKPIEVEAEQFNLYSSSTTPFLRQAICGKSHDGIRGANHIHTLEGVMEAQHNDWIIRGVNGEFYPCKPDIFEKTYEPISD